jgi:hypothetical protein
MVPPQKTDCPSVKTLAIAGDIWFKPRKRNSNPAVWNMMQEYQPLFLDDLTIYIAPSGAGSVDPENKVVVCMLSTHVRPEHYVAVDGHFHNLGHFTPVERGPSTRNHSV